MLKFLWQRYCAALVRLSLALLLSNLALFALGDFRAASQEERNQQNSQTPAPTRQRGQDDRTEPTAELNGESTLQQTGLPPLQPPRPRGVLSKTQINLPSRRAGVDPERFAVSRRLPPFNAATETTHETNAIGVARQVNLTTPEVKQGKLMRRIKNADGSEIRLLTIQSPGALEVFAHLTEFNLPAGEEVYVYGNSADSPVGGPYRGRGPAGQGRAATAAGGDFWTETATGDTLIIEHYSPLGAPRGSFAIPEITHHHTAFLTSAPEQTQPLGCHLDANCTSINLNNAVGRISFMRDGVSKVCSGTMVATRSDTEAGEPPYFLTANHCIATHTQARSAQITWQFRSTACNSGVVNDMFFTSPRGTGLLKTRRALDQTLLRVFDDLPAGQVYAGWDPRTIGLTDFPNVFGLHHPRGSFLRRSTGKLVLNQLGCDATGLYEGYDILWGDGITEPGSSGSGLFFADSQLLFGVLSCGVDVDSCSLKINSRYGRFREFYIDAATWLETGDRGPTPTAPLAAPTSTTPTVVNDTLTNALPSRVLGSQAGTSVYYGKMFRVNGQAGQKLRITATANNFTPYLYLLHGTTRKLLAEDVNVSDRGFSDITFTLEETAPYYIEVSSVNVSDTGAFTLKVELVCDFSLSKTNIFLPAKDGVAAAALNNPNRCDWTATSNAAWLKLRKTTGNNVFEAIVADVDAFTSNVGTRTGIIQIAGEQLQVHQTHQCVAAPIQVGQVLSGSLGITDCRAAVTNDNAEVYPYADLYSFSGTSGQRIAIELDSTEFTPRLRLLSPNGTLLTIDTHASRARLPYPQNYFTLNATGTFTIEASHNDEASQTGAYKIRVLTDCNTLVTPTPDTLAASGTTLNFSVTATTNCPWNAFSYASWIKINSGETGAGNGAVNVTIAPNLGPARTAVLTIAGRAFELQQRSGCRFSIDPTSRNFAAGGGSGSFNVTASDAECPWGVTATISPSGMVTFGQVLGQKGNGVVTYAVKANSGAARTAQLVVGEPGVGPSHDIIQAAVAPNPTPTITALSPTNLQAGSSRFVLTVTGENLVADTVIRWNGRALETRLTERNTVTAEISAAEIANAGIARVTLFNPAPGGGESASRNFTINGPLANLSAASFTNQFAPNGIIAAFGLRLATRTVLATTTPLPTELGGTTVKLLDGGRTERLAQLFFVSANQINYLVPTGTPAGQYTVLITSSDGSVSLGSLTVETVAPGLFTANANGQGAPAAVLLRVLANGTQRFEPVAEFDASLNRFRPLPLVVDNPGEQVILVLFGTGIRGRSALTRVTANFERNRLPVDFAGAQGLAGLDQVNLLLPARLAGNGETALTLSVDGKLSNEVLINFR